MQRIACLPAFLLVIALVLLTGPAAASPASGDGDPLSAVIGSVSAEMQNPILSPCSSPGWMIVYRYITNPGEEFNADHCIQFFAVQAGDTTQCEGIQRGAPKTKCYCLIASNKNDPSICNQVPATSDPQAYLKIDCWWEVAIRNNNPAACQAMGNTKISRMFIGEMSKQTCLARLASGQGVGASTL